MDYKTSTSMRRYHNMEKVQMQLAAYSMILKDEFGIEPTNFEVLHMTKFGSRLLRVKPDYKGFLKALELK